MYGWFSVDEENSLWLCLGMGFVKQSAAKHLKCWDAQVFMFESLWVASYFSFLVVSATPEPDSHKSAKLWLHKMFWSQAVLKCSAQLHSCAVLGTVTHLPGRCRCQVLYPVLAAGLFQQPLHRTQLCPSATGGAFWHSTSQKGHSTGNYVKSSWGSEDENVLQPLGRTWWSRISLQTRVGPHAGECGDFLKELWPWRVHAGVHLTWRTAAPREDHAGAGEECEKEGAAEKSWPDTTLPFPSELLKVGEAEVVCVKTKLSQGRIRKERTKCFNLYVFLTVKINFSSSWQ